MKKIVFIAALLSPFTFHLSPCQAQETGSYNESVLVRGAYRPVIEMAEKLNFPAVITDTAGNVEHNFLYSITPTRLRALYDPSRIKAARIIGEPTTKLYNNYIRFGLGNYWSPLLDLYWSSTRDTKKTYGVRVNHRSSWSAITSDDIKDYYGLTGITLFGKYIVGDLLQLSSDINYEHDHNLYYGFDNNTLATVMPSLTRDALELSDIRAKYNLLSWNIGLRNMELDANKLGYSANLRLSDLWASWNQNEFNLNLTGDVHYGFTMGKEYKGVAFLHFEWDGYTDRFHAEGEMPLGYTPAAPTDTVRGYRNIVKLNPYADFMLGGFQMHAGFTAGWDAFTGHSLFRFFPDVVVSKKLMDGNLVLSLGATGSLDANNWNTLRRVNPFLGPNAEQRATRHYDFIGHARWTISRKLEANAEISYSILQDDFTFTLDPNYSLGNVFKPLYLDDNRLTVGADIAFVNDEMLTLRAGGHYYHYEYTGLGIAGDTWVKYYRPDWDALVAADLNYNDKWLFHLEGQLLGSMQTDIADELPLRYGVNAHVEYRHNRALSFFLKMDNLAFQRYFYWAHYPSQRALFILGLTYTIPHK